MSECGEDCGGGGGVIRLRLRPVVAGDESTDSGCKRDERWVVAAQVTAGGQLCVCLYHGRGKRQEKASGGMY